MVEFALVFPFFAILLFGIIDLGRYVTTANALGNGVREGARFGSVGNRPSPQCDTLSREACTISVTRSNTLGIPTSAMTTTVTCERVLPNNPTPAAVAMTACRSNDFLRVRSQVTFTLVTPLIAQFIGSLNISAETRVLVNQ